MWYSKDKIILLLALKSIKHILLTNKQTFFIGTILNYVGMITTIFDHLNNLVRSNLGPEFQKNKSFCSLKYSSHERNWHPKSWAILQNFNFRMIKFTKKTFDTWQNWYFGVVVNFIIQKLKFFKDAWLILCHFLSWEGTRESGPYSYLVSILLTQLSKYPNVLA